MRFPRARFCMSAPSPSHLQRFLMERSALVTGGSSGIGLAIARALREDGFELTLASRTREKVEAAARDLDALAVAADIADEGDCRRVVDEHRARYGRLDVLGAAKAAVIQFTDTLNRGEQVHGVRATAISPGFVDTPMTDWSPVPKEEMIQPEDCAEIVRLLLRLSPYARIPHVVVERLGS